MAVKFVPTGRLPGWLKRPVVWLVGISLVWGGLSSYSLMTYPGPYIDEAWFASLAWNYGETGQYEVPIFPNLYGFPQDYTKLNYLYTTSLTAVFQVFEAGLLQVRVFSMFGAWLSGILLFYLGRRLYDPMVGIIAATLYLFSLHLLRASHMGRPETWVNAIDLLILLAFLYVRETRNPRHAFWLGVLAVVSLNFSAIVVQATLVVGLFGLIEFRQRKDWHILRMFIMGGGLGVVIWLLIQAFPNPAGKIDTFLALRPQSPKVPQENANPLLNYLQFFKKILEFWHLRFVAYSRLGPIEAGYTLLGIAGLGLRRKYEDIFVLASLVIALLGFTFIYYLPYHTMDVVPLIVLGIASAIMGSATWLIERYKVLQKLPSEMIAVMLAAPLIGGYLVSMIVLGWQNRVIDYNRYANALKELVPPDASVYGEANWWWAFREQPYQADDFLNFGFVPDDADPDVAIRSILGDTAVNVILRDELIGSFYVWPTLKKYEDALSRYIDTNCTLLGDVEDYIVSSYHGGPAKKHTFVYQCPVLTPADVAQQ